MSGRRHFLLTTYKDKTLNARGFEMTIHIWQGTGPHVINIVQNLGN